MNNDGGEATGGEGGGGSSLRYCTYVHRLYPITGLSWTLVGRDLPALLDLPHPNDPRRKASLENALGVRETRDQQPLELLCERPDAESGADYQRLLRLCPVPPARLPPCSYHAVRAPSVQDPRRVGICELRGHARDEVVRSLVESDDVPVDQNSWPVLNVDLTDWPHSCHSYIELCRRQDLPPSPLPAEGDRLPGNQGEIAHSLDASLEILQDETEGIYRPDDYRGSLIDGEDELQVEYVVQGRDKRRSPVTWHRRLSDDEPNVVHVKVEPLQPRPIPRLDDSCIDLVDLCDDEEQIVEVKPKIEPAEDSWQRRRRRSRSVELVSGPNKLSECLDVITLDDDDDDDEYVHAVPRENSAVSSSALGAAEARQSSTSNYTSPSIKVKNISILLKPEINEKTYRFNDFARSGHMGSDKNPAVASDRAIDKQKQTAHAVATDFQCSVPRIAQKDKDGDAAAAAFKNSSATSPKPWLADKNASVVKINGNGKEAKNARPDALVEFAIPETRRSSAISKNTRRTSDGLSCEENENADARGDNENEAQTRADEKKRGNRQLEASTAATAVQDIIGARKKTTTLADRLPTVAAGTCDEEQQQQQQRPFEGNIEIDNNANPQTRRNSENEKCVKNNNDNSDVHAQKLVICTEVQDAIFDIPCAIIHTRPLECKDSISGTEKGVLGKSCNATLGSAIMDTRENEQLSGAKEKVAVEEAPQNEEKQLGVKLSAVREAVGTTNKKGEKVSDGKSQYTEPPRQIPKRKYEEDYSELIKPFEVIYGETRVERFEAGAPQLPERPPAEKRKKNPSGRETTVLPNPASCIDSSVYCSPTISQQPKNDNVSFVDNSSTLGSSKLVSQQQQQQLVASTNGLTNSPVRYNFPTHLQTPAPNGRGIFADYPSYGGFNSCGQIVATTARPQTATLSSRGIYADYPPYPGFNPYGQIATPAAAGNGNYLDASYLAALQNYALNARNFSLTWHGLNFLFRVEPNLTLGSFAQFCERVTRSETFWRNRINHWSQSENKMSIRDVTEIEKSDSGTESMLFSDDGKNDKILHSNKSTTRKNVDINNIYNQSAFEPVMKTSAVQINPPKFSYKTKVDFNDNTLNVYNQTADKYKKRHSLPTLVSPQHSNSIRKSRSKSHQELKDTSKSTTLSTIVKQTNQENHKNQVALRNKEHGCNVTNPNSVRSIDFNKSKCIIKNDIFLKSCDAIVQVYKSKKGNDQEVPELDSNDCGNSPKIINATNFENSLSPFLKSKLKKKRPSSSADILDYNQFTKKPRLLKNEHQPENNLDLPIEKSLNLNELLKNVLSQPYLDISSFDSSLFYNKIGEKKNFKSDSSLSSNELKRNSSITSNESRVIKYSENNYSSFLTDNFGFDSDVSNNSVISSILSEPEITEDITVNSKKMEIDNREKSIIPFNGTTNIFNKSHASKKNKLLPQEKSLDQPVWKKTELQNRFFFIFGDTDISNVEHTCKIIDDTASLSEKSFEKTCGSLESNELITSSETVNNNLTSKCKENFSKSFQVKSLESAEKHHQNLSTDNKLSTLKINSNNADNQESDTIGQKSKNENFFDKSWKLLKGDKPVSSTCTSRDSSDLEFKDKKLSDKHYRWSFSDYEAATKTRNTVTLNKNHCWSSESNLNTKTKLHHGNYQKLKNRQFLHKSVDTFKSHGNNGETLIDNGSYEEKIENKSFPSMSKICYDIDKTFDNNEKSKNKYSDKCHQKSSKSHHDDNYKLKKLSDKYKKSSENEGIEAKDKSHNNIFHVKDSHKHHDISSKNKFHVSSQPHFSNNYKIKIKKSNDYYCNLPNENSSFESKSDYNKQFKDKKSKKYQSSNENESFVCISKKRKSSHKELNVSEEFDQKSKINEKTQTVDKSHKTSKSETEKANVFNSTLLAEKIKLSKYNNISESNEISKENITSTESYENNVKLNVSNETLDVDMVSDKCLDSITSDDLLKSKSKELDTNDISNENKILNLNVTDNDLDTDSDDDTSNLRLVIDESEISENRKDNSSTVHNLNISHNQEDETSADYNEYNISTENTSTQAETYKKSSGKRKLQDQISNELNDLFTTEVNKSPKRLCLESSEEKTMTSKLNISINDINNSDKISINLTSETKNMKNSDVDFSAKITNIEISKSSELENLEGGDYEFHESLRNNYNDGYSDDEYDVTSEFNEGCNTHNSFDSNTREHTQNSDENILDCNSDKKNSDSDANENYFDNNTDENVQHNDKHVLDTNADKNISDANSNENSITNSNEHIKNNNDSDLGINVVKNTSDTNTNENISNTNINHENELDDDIVYLNTTISNNKKKKINCEIKTENMDSDSAIRSSTVENISNPQQLPDKENEKVPVYVPRSKEADDEYILQLLIESMEDSPSSLPNTKGSEEINNIDTSICSERSREPVASPTVTSTVDNETRNSDINTSENLNTASLSSHFWNSSSVSTEVQNCDSVSTNISDNTQFSSSLNKSNNKYNNSICNNESSSILNKEMESKLTFKINKNISKDLNNPKILQEFNLTRDVIAPDEIKIEPLDICVNNEEKENLCKILEDTCNSIVKNYNDVAEKQSYQITNVRNVADTELQVDTSIKSSIVLKVPAQTGQSSNFDLLKTMNINLVNDIDEIKDLTTNDSTQDDSMANCSLENSTAEHVLPTNNIITKEPTKIFKLRNISELLENSQSSSLMNATSQELNSSASKNSPEVTTSVQNNAHTLNSMLQFNTSISQNLPQCHTVNLPKDNHAFDNPIEPINCSPLQQLLNITSAVSTPMQLMNFSSSIVYQPSVVSMENLSTVKTTSNSNVTNFLQSNQTLSINNSLSSVTSNLDSSAQNSRVVLASSIFTDMFSDSTNSSNATESNSQMNTTSMRNAENSTKNSITHIDALTLLPIHNLQLPDPFTILSEDNDETGKQKVQKYKNLLLEKIESLIKILKKIKNLKMVEDDLLKYKLLTKTTWLFQSSIIDIIKCCISFMNIHAEKRAIVIGAVINSINPNLQCITNSKEHVIKYAARIYKELLTRGAVLNVSQILQEPLLIELENLKKLTTSRVIEQNNVPQFTKEQKSILCYQILSYRDIWKIHKSQLLLSKLQSYTQ